MARLLFTCAVALATLGHAAPTSEILVERQLALGSVLSLLGLGPIPSGTNTTLLSTILQTDPKSTPSSIAQVLSITNNISKSGVPSDPLRASAYAQAGLTVNYLINLLSLNLADPAPGSFNNNNPRSPSSPVFPRKSAQDAPYDLTEAALRAAIHIPPTFTYGQKPPVVLVPGTGATGYVTFAANFIKLLTGVTYADPVWLNIPGFLLGDAQVNAEYVAYAINYISGISNNRNVSIIAWSQGNLDSQWALKYWPSTRNITSNLISISPDFHGTVFANVICPGLSVLVCTPAILQQTYDSTFVSALRNNGGDSAYVPTTTIYSSTDEIVQPQDGTGASAFILDARRVGVSNNQVQTVCAGRVGAGPYTHEGILYHPLAYALAVDALTKGGPGLTSRINVNAVCDQIAAPGLDLVDVLATEATIPFVAANILLYPNKGAEEPPLKAYALRVQST